MSPPCEICGEPVESWHTAAFPITGWEVARYGGGANQIKARRRVPGRIAHATCLERKLGREKRGISDAQMELG